MSKTLFYTDILYRDSTTITKVVLPESVTGIGFFAFSNSDNLEYIVLKNDNVALNPYAIDDCDNVTIVSAEGSTGQKYAEENDIPWMELEE